MTLKTRQPTGKPPWPILLIAGLEKSGKSYSAAQASASELVGRTFWVSVGEDEPDELGALPGARFEIVEHDGTYRGIRSTLDECAGQLPTDGKPNLLVLDSATRLWDLLCDEQQIEANRRAAEKARKYNRPVGEDDAQITADLWNVAKQRWAHCIDCLRAHQGPSIVLARMESVAIMDANGQPTKNRDWKIKAEKTLPFDVGAIVEMRARGDNWITGVRSVKYPLKEPRVEFPDFTVEGLWTRLGLTDKGATAHRTHSGIDAEDKPLQAAAVARDELRAFAEAEGWDLDAVAAAYADRAGGMALKDATSAPAIRAFMKSYAAEQKKVEKAA